MRVDASHNPYAPSRASLAAREVGTGARLWRLENVLIMSRDSGELPDRCVKCNDAAHEPTKTRTVHWHHPGFYLLLLINVILYLVVALIARKTVKVNPGLCARHKQKRALGLWIGWSGLIVGLAAMSLAARNDQPGAALLLLFATFGSIIAGMITSRIVYAKRIDDRYVRLKG